MKRQAPRTSVRRVARQTRESNTLDRPGRAFDLTFDPGGEDQSVPLESQESPLEDPPIRRRQSVNGDIGDVCAEVLAGTSERLLVVRGHEQHAGVRAIHPELRVFQQALEDDRPHSFRMAAGAATYARS